MSDANCDDARESSAALFGFGLLVGGVIAGSLALLLAPDAGRRTRERLRGLVGEARERTLDAAEEVRDRIEDVIDQGRTVVEANKAAITTAYEAGREAFHRERDRLRGLNAEPAGATDATPSTPEGPVSIS